MKIGYDEDEYTGSWSGPPWHGADRERQGLWLRALPAGPVEDLL